MVLTHYLVGVANFTLEWFEKSLDIIYIKQFNHPKHPWQPKQLGPLAGVWILLENLEGKYRDEIDNKPTLEIPKCDLLILKHQFLLLNIPVALEKREYEIEIEEWLNYHVENIKFVRLHYYECHIKHAINTRVSN